MPPGSATAKAPVNAVIARVLQPSSTSAFQMKRLLFVAILIVMSASASGADTAPLTEVTWGTISPQAAEWPTYIAEAQGFFKDEGLHVSVIYTGSPVNAINALATNATNMGDNGSDNLIAAISHSLPIKMIGGIFTPMPYSLVALPSIRNWADLKGKSITLATKRDVTAIVFSQMAAPHGMTIDDFSIVTGGTSNLRYAALTSGNVQAAILSQPFDLIAEAAGMHVLSSAHDAMKDWTFSSIAVNQTWAANNRPTIVKMLRALRKAIRYGYSHKDQAVALLVAEGHVDPEIAKRAYDVDFTKWHAFDEGFRFSETSLRYIEKLQTDIGALTSTPALAQVYDPTYAAEALR